MMTLRHKLAFSLLGLLVGLLLATAISVVAQPAPGSGKSLIPYEGVLEQDGQPVNANGDNALSITYTFFDGQEADATEIYSQTLETHVYRGRFTVGLGPIDEQGRVISDVARDYDNIYMGMVIGNGTDEGIVMAGRQRILATPYSMSSSKATNFQITGDAQIGGDLQLAGALRFPSHEPTDTAFARVRQEPGETTVFELGVTNDRNDKIEITHNGAPKITIDEAVTVNANTLNANTLNANTLNVTNLQASNLTVGEGFAVSLPRTEDFNRTTTRTMPPSSTHFCALTQVRFGDDNDEDDTSRCIVFINGQTQNWELQGRTNSNEADGACSAHCFRFR